MSRDVGKKLPLPKARIPEATATRRELWRPVVIFALDSGGKQTFLQAGVPHQSATCRATLSLPPQVQPRPVGTSSSFFHPGKKQEKWMFRANLELLPLCCFFPLHVPLLPPQLRMAEDGFIFLPALKGLSFKGT